MFVTLPPPLTLRGCLRSWPVWNTAGLSTLSSPPSFRASLPSAAAAARSTQKLTFCIYTVMATNDNSQPAPRRGRPPKVETERRRRELSKKQRAYVLWEASNHETRQPRTLNEFCEVIGVSRQMVWTWSKDPRVVEAIRFVTLQNAGEPLKVKGLLDMVYEVAMLKRDPKLAEVWLKATGVFSQFGRTGDLLEIPDDAETESFENFSFEQLVALREEALAANLESVSIEIAQRKLAESQSADLDES